jgi:YD repeat-containing protein
MIRSRRIRFASLLGAALALAVAPAANAAITYTYDTLGRLVRVDYGGGNYVVYQYDAAGNRTAIGNSSTNVAPTAVNDAVSTNQNTATTFDPRVNDTDPDYDPLTITAKTNGTHGTVSINSGTSLTYTPTTGYHGSDSFTYTISDGASHTSTATVSVTIVNRPPVATPYALNSWAGAAVTFNPLSSVSDPDGDTLTITAKTNGAHGAVTLNSGTSLTYTPTSGYYGTDSFSYTVSDGQGNTTIGTVNATVGTAPVAGGPDSCEVTATYTGTPVAPSGDCDPTGNDSDADGDTFTVTAVSTPAHGTASIVGAHTVHYAYGSTLIGDQTRTDSFTYTITDSHGNTATATINVTITLIDGT